MSPRRYCLSLCCAALVAAFLAAPQLSRSDSTPPNQIDRATLLHRVKDLQRRRMLSGGLRHIRAGQEQARLAKSGKKATGKRSAMTAARAKSLPGARQRRTPISDELGLAGRGLPPLLSRPSVQALSTTLGPNVLCNDTTGNMQTAAGQAEPSIAAWRDYVLVAFNDGQGFEEGLNSNLVAYAYSVDGGVTFTPGDLPKPTTAAIWTSDPVVTVNEKTGEFFFVALIAPTQATNGLAIARATFSGTTIHWDTPKIIRSESNSTYFIDKPWVAADSISGRLYVSYTTFDVNGDNISLQRSQSAWNATWSPAVTMNDAESYGYVQGSRPAVGPNGEVYVTWKELGPVDADYFRIRKSTDHGLTFSAAQAAATVYDNFGTGAPGFNRDRGITFPSIAIDRSTGPRRGRVYLAWNEAINWYRAIDTIGNLGTTSEVEPNYGPALATPFITGVTLNGGFSNVGDIDWYKFTAVQGVSYTFLGSVPNCLYSMRIICSDDTTRLNLAGDLDAPVDTVGYITWTCPRNGTYFLRMFNNISPNTTGSSYEILTGPVTPGPEPGRDQRDAMVVTSDDGVLWSTPVRINQDPPYFDNWLPEIGVGGNGDAYAIWFGWHEAPDTTCGGESHVYLAKSTDGGSTWGDVGRLTEAITPWTRTFSNIQPNQGDYLGLYVNELGVYPVWSEGRNGNPDVYTVTVPHGVTPTLVSLADGRAEPGRITVSWYSAAPSVQEAYVYRTHGADWELEGVIERDGVNRLTYVDTDVVPGGTYTYRLGIRDGDVERYAGHVTIVVPSLARLRIDGVRPNPTARNVWVSFSLPSAAPATLSLVDISGRRIREHAVGSLGNGRHLLDLGAGTKLAAGVYIVRLEQAGRVETARVSVVR